MYPVIAIIDFPVVITIAAVMVLLFGADRIPKFARSLGQAKREFAVARGDSTQAINPATSIDYTVPGVVPTVLQPSGNTCWAATSAMMIGWKSGLSAPSIRGIVAGAGAAYAAKFDGDDGLSGLEKIPYLQALGLVSEAPQTYLPLKWLSVLTLYGPLWVTAAEGSDQSYSIHARVITSINGDGSPDGTLLTILDPDGGAPSPYLRTVTQLSTEIERLAKADLHTPNDLRPQVVHFP